MVRKIVLAAAIFFIGFTIKDIKAGETIYLEERIILFVFALGVFAFKEWVEIPYDWDKHTNKGKEKKDLR